MIKGMIGVAIGLVTYIKFIVSRRSNLTVKTSLIRGNLNLLRHGNPDLADLESGKGRDFTRGIRQTDEEKVRLSGKPGRSRVVTQLVAALVTGTGTGDVIICLVTCWGNLACKMRQIRGKLNLAIGRLIAELNQRLNLGNCGETRRRKPLLGLWYSPILSESSGQSPEHPGAGRSLIPIAAARVGNCTCKTQRSRGSLNLITELICQ